MKDPCSIIKVTMELSSTSLRAGVNYLSQSTNPRSSSTLAVPSPGGAALVRPADCSAEEVVSCVVDGESNDADAAPSASSVTILAVARSPAAPELLAIAQSAEDSVQVWSAAPSSKATLVSKHEGLGGTCRQLCWHPHRRLLTVATPRQMLLIELPRGPASTSQCHTLPLPAQSTGALSSCCWGLSGGVLAAACESEVVLYRWPLLGADWSAFTVVRYPISARRLCTLQPWSPCSPVDMSCSDGGDGGDDDDDGDGDGIFDDEFALGLGVPITTGDAADMSMRSTGAPRKGGGTGTSMADGDGDGGSSQVLDLRGRLGGGIAAGASESAASPLGVLDLSGELAALRPSAALERKVGAAEEDQYGALGHPSQQGAVVLAGASGGGPASEVVRHLTHPTPVGTPQPDLLASTGQCAHGAALLAAASSSAGGGNRIWVFACSARPPRPRAAEAMDDDQGATFALELSPVCVLAAPDGYRWRGLSFGGGSGRPARQLYALGGKRAQASVVFSAPRAEQKLVLCAYEKELEVQPDQHEPPPPPPPPKAAAAAAEAPPPQESPSPLNVAPSLAGAAPIAVDTPSVSSALPAFGLGDLFAALQSHLDGRFERIERSVAALDQRLTRVEAAIRGASGGGGVK